MDWNAQATWDQFYRIEVRDPASPLFGQVVGYGRAGQASVACPTTPTLDKFLIRWTGRDYEGRYYHDGLLGSLPFTILPAHRILVAACADGYLIEAAHDTGYPNVWGIDPSEIVTARAPTESRGDILIVRDDFTGGGRIRNALKQMTGDNKFDVVITEDLLTCLTDAEIPPYLSAAETVLAGSDARWIVHMVQEPPCGPGLNSHTLEEWKALGPDYTWVSIRPSQWRVL